VLAQPLGEGAQLCPLEPWQAAEFLRHVEAIRPHLAPWIPFAATVVDLDSARAFLQRYADRMAADDGRLYAIRVGGELAGGVLFRTFDAASGVCEVGVWLAPEAEGRGLVTRAVTHMIDWAVEARGMQRVEWHTDPANERSAAVARRLGMRREGVLRSSFVLGRERRDTEIWAVLADEWRVRRSG
jgi:ribosomal-protein-serine acetyltransferase